MGFKFHAFSFKYWPISSSFLLFGSKRIALPNEAGFCQHPYWPILLVLTVRTCPAIVKRYSVDSLQIMQAISICTVMILCEQNAIEIITGGMH